VKSVVSTINTNAKPPKSIHHTSASDRIFREDPPQPAPAFVLSQPSAGRRALSSATHKFRMRRLVQASNFF
jgi:hypothetical protein